MQPHVGRRGTGRLEVFFADRPGKPDGGCEKEGFCVFVQKLRKNGGNRGGGLGSRWWTIMPPLGTCQKPEHVQELHNSGRIIEVLTLWSRRETSGHGYPRNAPGGRLFPIARRGGRGRLGGADLIEEGFGVGAAEGEGVEGVALRQVELRAAEMDLGQVVVGLGEEGVQLGGLRRRRGRPRRGGTNAPLSNRVHVTSLGVKCWRNAHQSRDR